MTRTVSIALVGAGYWSNKLLPKFLATPDCSVKMICDLDAGHRASAEEAFPNIPTTDSYDHVLHNPNIDAVLITTPPATHFSLAEKALEAGKHIWVEKPLAMRLDEGKILVGLAQTRGTVLFVDHTFLYDPAIRMIRDLIKKGELGDIYHVFLQRLNLGRIKRDSNVWWNSAPHDVSILLYLSTAQPVGITLHGYRYLQRDIEDINMAAIDMSDGTSAFIYHNWLYPENTAKLTVVGSKRLLTYEGKFVKREGALYDYAVDLCSQENEPNQHRPTTIASKIVGVQRLEGVDIEEPLAVAVSDFLECVRAGRAPLSDGNFSLKVLAVLEAGEESLRAGGRKIRLDI